MNQMPSFDMQDRVQEMPLSAPQATSYLIKRAGLRPLRFDGSELCMAMSFVPGAPYWYEINLYRTTQQRFVAAVRIFFRSEDERDRVRAWDCESFEAALERLETYDAGRDIRVERFAEAEVMSAAELAAHGYTLQAQVEAARAQYAGLLGELLHELEQGA